MTYNIQHCANFETGIIDFDAVANAILQSGADIVGLNEVGGVEFKLAAYAEQAEILATKLGWYYYFAEAVHFAGDEPYGNALLSRYPILTAETVPVPNPMPRHYDGYYEERCLLRAKIDLADKPITVCVIHFGLNPDEQENALQTVFRSIEAERCVLMGDFNITPDNPLLVSLTTKMTDTAASSADALLTFPSDNPYCKIDYIFVSHDIAVKDVCVPPYTVSDHRPVKAGLTV